MCLTDAATVIAVSDLELVVDRGGRHERVMNLLLPDARVGDEVLVGMGRALARLAPAEAKRLRSLHALLTPDAVAAAAGPEAP